MPMLSDMPLTRSVDFQARAVDNRLPSSAGRANSQDRRQGTLSSTQSAVVRYRQIESEQLREPRNKALRPSQTEMKH